MDMGDGHVRIIVNLARAIEAAVARRDTVSALLALATLREVLSRHFARRSGPWRRWRAAPTAATPTSTAPC